MASAGRWQKKAPKATQRALDALSAGGKASNEVRRQFPPFYCLGPAIPTPCQLCSASAPPSIPIPPPTPKLPYPRRWQRGSLRPTQVRSLAQATLRGQRIPRGRCIVGKNEAPALDVRTPGAGARVTGQSQGPGRRRQAGDVRAQSAHDSPRKSRNHQRKQIPPLFPPSTRAQHAGFCVRGEGLRSVAWHPPPSLPRIRSPPP